MTVLPVIPEAEAFASAIRDLTQILRFHSGIPDRAARVRDDG